MKLSEEIALGRHLVTPRGGNVFNCAIGMANLAVGERAFTASEHYTKLKQRHPWIMKIQQGSCILCRKEFAAPVELLYHLFDVHVMGMYDGGVMNPGCPQIISFEDFLDRVAAFEPIEQPEPELPVIEVLFEEKVAGH